MLLSVAQWERETTGERTREALRRKINNGERCGKVRIGFDLAADVTTLTPSAAERGVSLETAAKLCSYLELGLASRR